MEFKLDPWIKLWKNICLIIVIFASTLSPAFSAENSSETESTAVTTTGEPTANETLVSGSESSAGSEPSANNAPSTNEPTAEDLSASEEDSSSPTEDTFVPSTQISEDLSVSFPVNI